MVTCRPDISFQVIKLAQYSTKPARIHFEAVKHLYKYLAATKSEGLYYWRKTHRHDLPHGIIPPCNHNLMKMSSEDRLEILPHIQNTPHILETAVDSDHAGDTSHRKLVTGIVHRLAGGTKHYKTKYTDIIPTSSTEAEFIAADEAAKQILYLRSILDEIEMPQDMATTLYEDNQGALLMANAQQPTKRSRHMDIKYFALQDWVKRDLLLLKRIQTKNNYSDALTKPLQRVLFYKHMNYINGKYIPEYAKQTRDSQCIKKVCFNIKENKKTLKHGRVRCTDKSPTPLKDKYPLNRRKSPSATADVSCQKVNLKTQYSDTNDVRPSTKVSEHEPKLPLTDTLDDTLDTFLCKSTSGDNRSPSLFSHNL